MARGVATRLLACSVRICCRCWMLSTERSCTVQCNAIGWPDDRRAKNVEVAARPQVEDSVRKDFRVLPKIATAVPEWEVQTWRMK
jgi:hypothetical protein